MARQDEDPMGEAGSRAGRGIPPAMTQARLEKAALHYLERFAAASAHLRRVLLRKVERAAALRGEDPAPGAALVDALIARYRAAGLLDDDAYAAAQAASLRRRGVSRQGIRGRLAQKGVAAEGIAQALEALDGESGGAGRGDLAAAAAFARRRRLGPYRPPEARTARRGRDLAALARAGFARDIASRVVSAASPDALDALVSGET